MRRALVPVLLLASAAGFAACETPLEGLFAAGVTEGPEVTFDLLARPLPEIPFPNDIATRIDLDSPTGRRVNASMTAPSLTEQDVRKEFDLLDGWGTFAPITVSFDRPLEPLTIRRAHRDNDDWGDDAVYLVNLVTGEPTRLDLGRGNFPVIIEEPENYFENDPRGKGATLLFETYAEDLNNNGVLDPGEDTDGDGTLDVPNTVDPKKPLYGADPSVRAPAGQTGNDVYRDLLDFYERESNTLIIRPVMPLEQRTTYAVVLTTRLHDVEGRSIRSPFAFVNHAAQTDQLRPLLGYLDGRIPGLTRETVAFAWAFTTQTVTRDLETIREGLYGRGPLAWIGSKVSDRLEPVQTLAAARESPVVDNPVYPLMTQARADRDNGGNPYIVDGASILKFIEKLGGSADVGVGSEYASLTDAYSFVDHIVIGSFRSPDFMDDPSRPTTDAVFRLNADKGIAQLYERPPNWLDLEYEMLDARVAVTADATAKQRIARFALRDRITFMLVVPKAHDGFKAPFPVVLHAHGSNSSREEVLAFGGHLAKVGVAVVGINGFAHGLDLEPALKTLVQGFLGQEGLAPLGNAIFTGRARDLDLDGKEDSGGDFWVADTFHARDALRQTIVDWLQLIRVFHAFGTYEMGDLNGDGKPELAGDFDADGTIDVSGPLNLPDGTPSKGHDFYMQGISLGGITTAVAVALDPSIVAAAPICGGGGLGDIAVRSDLGQVTKNVFPDLFGPMFVTRPSGDGVDLFALVGGIQTVVTLKLNDAPLDVLPGDRLELENLDNDGVDARIDSALVGSDRRVRLQVAADRAEYLDDSPFDGGKVRVAKCEDPSVLSAETKRMKLMRPADCLVVRVFRKDASGAEKLIETFDKFGVDVPSRGRIYPAGSPLAALQRGLGFKRQTKTFRRFMALAQTILDPADPVNYAPFYFDRTLPARAGHPAAVLMIPSQGDMGVPITTGYTLARVAGLLPYVYDAQRDADWGMSPNDVVIRTHASEAVEKLEYFTPIAEHMAHPDVPLSPEDAELDRLVFCETEAHCRNQSLPDLFNFARDEDGAFLDDPAPYMRGYGGVPRLKKPFQGDIVTRRYKGLDAHGKPRDLESKLAAVYPDAHGRHVFDAPDGAQSFDIGLFVINMVGVFFAEEGAKAHTDLCLHRDGFDRARKEPGATRVDAPACRLIPDYPAKN